MGLRCRLRIHCYHRVDSELVRRRTHFGRDSEVVKIYEDECCRCPKIGFGEYPYQGFQFPNREEGENR